MQSQISARFSQTRHPFRSKPPCVIKLKREEEKKTAKLPRSKCMNNNNDGATARVRFSQDALRRHEKKKKMKKERGLHLQAAELAISLCAVFAFAS